MLDLQLREACAQVRAHELETWNQRKRACCAAHLGGRPVAPFSQQLEACRCLHAHERLHRASTYQVLIGPSVPLPPWRCTPQLEALKSSDRAREQELTAARTAVDGARKAVKEHENDYTRSKAAAEKDYALEEEDKCVRAWAGQKWCRPCVHA